ncbi:MAG TPA: hypothetical protein GX503_07905 [Clostridiales bacterium]|nr:hypothetical protein [Clostridiales bacterium]
MEEFDRISIEEISKKDMLMIIKALEYTGQNTCMESFIELKNSILKQLCALTQTTEEEILSHLEK